MKTEMDVLNRLRDTIANYINDYVPEDLFIEDMQVVVDYPDTDNMPKGTMVYIEPENAEYSTLTMDSDLTVLNATLYILCKKEASNVLLQRVFKYASAISSLIRQHQSLDEYIDFTTINTLEFYPSVDASKTIKAIELSISLQWEKDWL